MMTSQESYNGGSGGIMAASQEGNTVQEVQSLKALSLNGLNRDICQPSNASDLQSSESLPSTDKLDERPKPRLSWGNVTEIPGGSSSNFPPYEKHSGLPMGGASSSGNPWQIRSTQNPARPLVRRPTPMAISISKSVLGKGASKMNTGSFEEMEEDEENDDHVSVSLKETTNTGVLVIEDLEVDDDENELKESGVSIPQDLPLNQVAGNLASSTERNLDTGSPTILVQTHLGKQLALEEAAEIENNEVEDEVEKEHDEFDANKQFLDPSTSSSFGRNSDPPATNTHIQTVPHQPRRLVRRPTPQALDIPESLKCLASAKMNVEILEEEEEDEEEEAKAATLEEDSSKATNIQVSTSSTAAVREEISESPSGPSDYNVPSKINAAAEPSSLGDSSRDGKGTKETSSISRPLATVNSDNYNNNHTDPAFHQSDVATGKINEPKGHLEGQASQPGRTATPRFQKSFSRDQRDGSRSPLSVRRKVSEHHTKILTRKLTPLQIEVPKSVLAEFVKSKTSPSLEEKEEDSS